MTISTEEFEAILQTGHLNIEYRCPDCKGTGINQEADTIAECTKCGQTWQTPEQHATLAAHMERQDKEGVAIDTQTMPCGDSIRYWRDSDNHCVECEASGIRVARLTMPELAQVVAAAILQQPGVLNTLRHA